MHYLYRTPVSAHIFTRTIEYRFVISVMNDYQNVAKKKKKKKNYFYRGISAHSPRPTHAPPTTPARIKYQAGGVAWWQNKLLPVISKAWSPHRAGRPGREDQRGNQHNENRGVWSLKTTAPSGIKRTWARGISQRRVKRRRWQTRIWRQARTSRACVARDNAGRRAVSPAAALGA